MSARGDILSSVRRSLQRQAGDGALDSVTQRLSAPPAQPVPARARLDSAERADLFAKMAEAVGASVERVASLAEAPSSVARFLAAHNLGARIVASPEAAALDWKRTSIEVRSGRAQAEDEAGVSLAFAGVAETGTLAFASSPTTPVTVNFLPENHVAILPLERLGGTYEEVWQKLRAQGDWPGSVNFVTGPSRSGDIEQTIQVGAHGPRRLHILLVGDGA